MKFSEIAYHRPDLELAKERMAGLTARLEQATSFAQAERAFLEMEQLTGSIGTLESVASIRHDIDTRDAFYDKEVEYFDARGPELQAYSQKWTLALLHSPFRREFADRYGELMFRNAELELKSFSPEIIPELQRENALVTEYSKLLASAQIPFEGEMRTLSQMSPFKVAADDALRLAAWQAEAGFYVENGARLDEIYDELVKLRDTMGKKLGYPDYTELGYCRMQRNCYTKADVERFRAAVVRYLVPVADRIYRRQAERLGKAYPMHFADNALEFRSGNPKPAGSPDEILEQGRRFYHELSPETAEFIDFMLDGAFMDVLSRPGKAGGGYCTSLRDYKAPFIFANFNGTSHDVEVITHEAGHAFAMYTNRDRVPASSVLPSLEACEVHSMSMEFFAWPWAGGFFGADARKFYYTHLSGALTFIPYGTMVDHFQHIVYEKPEMTPAQRHETWRELLGVYMPWMRLGDEIPFYGQGKGWQRQSHIYQAPFYYIDYCLAQTVSLQFWARIQQDRAAAWQTYMAYTEPGGSRTFVELLQGAGLESPFEEACLRHVSEQASAWLDAYDLTGIV